MWSFHGLPDVVFDICEFLSALALVIVVAMHYHAIDEERMQFRFNVLLFLLLPLVSMIPAAIFHNQSFWLSFSILRTNFAWLLYFVLHIFKVPRKFVITWMTIVGVVWALLTIIQQFTFPYYWFYTRDAITSGDFFRAGLYRFMLDPHLFGTFIVIYYYNSFLVNWKWQSLLIVIIGLVGFYCYTTRQVALAVVICMVIISVMQPGRAKYVALSVMAIGFILLLLNLDALLGSYIELTSEQLAKDNIRIYSAKYFLFEYWPHWTTVLFGNGAEHMNSDYGKEIAGLGENLGYFKGDVGLISPLSTFGILYVLNIIFVNLKGLRPSYYGTAKSYFLPALFLYSLMLLLISEHYAYPAAIPYFCMIFYLVDKSYWKRRGELPDEAEEEDHLLRRAG